MCGIAGILQHDHRMVDRDQIESMTGAMVHRGPDDAGIYLDRYVGLGHRRLSIVDRSTGHQPMCNEDETVWITFNGEIYNYQEIREELLAAGHELRTHSDTEVIVHLYEDLGEGCLHRLRGMFAFAVWDKPKNTLLIARDRLGIKPLYYVSAPTFLAFASEIKALLKLESVQPKVDLQALHDYLTFCYNVAPQTVFAGIRKLEPGHFLKVTDGVVARESYWDLDFSKKLVMAESDLIEELSQRFRSCVQSHLIGEVPLGVFLSGGLDSTAITAVLSEIARNRVKTFSIGYADKQGSYADERSYARLAASHYQTDHYEITIGAQEYADGLLDYVRAMEEPMADPSSIPLYYVAKLARKHVTVILSGEGSDELFAGYTFWAPFKGINRARWFRTIPSPIRRYLIGPLNQSLIRSVRLRRYLELARLPHAHYFQVRPAFMPNVFAEEMKYELYGRRVVGELRRSEETVVAAYRRAGEFEFLDQMLYVYSKQWLPDHTLLKSDKMTMAHSMELRVPFLDHTFVEFAASLPVDMKIKQNGHRGYVTKYILRRAFEGQVPKEIIERRKLGFPVPLGHFFDERLFSLAQDLIHSRAFRQSGLFDVDQVDALLRKHETSRSEYVWPLLVWAVWLDTFQASP